MAMATTCTEVVWEQTVRTDRLGQCYQYEQCVLVSDENQAATKSNSIFILTCVIAALFVIVVAGCLASVLFEYYPSDESVHVAVAPTIPGVANQNPVFFYGKYRAFIVIQ
jgi:heme/copper-type cytochrome/quinol oxidase subunit 2